MLPMWRCSARRRLDGDLQTFCTILHRSAPAPAPHLGGYIGTGCRADNRAAQLLALVAVTAVTLSAGGSTPPSLTLSLGGELLYTQPADLDTFHTAADSEAMIIMSW